MFPFICVHLRYTLDDDDDNLMGLAESIEKNGNFPLKHINKKKKKKKKVLS